MKKTLFSLALAAAVCGTTFTSCKKDDEAQPQSEETSVQDNTAGTAISEDIVDIGDDVLNANSGSLRVSGEGKAYYGAMVTITKGEVQGTGTVEIDFGTEGKKTRDGKLHKGKIKIDYTKPSRESGAKRVFSFVGYSVDGVKVEGSKTVTFSAPVNNVFVATIVSDLTFTAADGSVATWKSNRTRKHDTKGTPLDRTDDVITIFGTASGTNMKKEAYTVVIAEATPLVHNLKCMPTSGWVAVSGKVEVTPAGGVKRTVDYGDVNSCDRKATVTIGDKSFEVIIK